MTITTPARQRFASLLGRGGPRVTAPPAAQSPKTHQAALLRPAHARATAPVAPLSRFLHLTGTHTVPPAAPAGRFDHLAGATILPGAAPVTMADEIQRLAVARDTLAMALHGPGASASEHASAGMRLAHTNRALSVAEAAAAGLKFLRSRQD